MQQFYAGVLKVAYEISVKMFLFFYKFYLLLLEIISLELFSFEDLFLVAVQLV